jgi:peptidoglycan/xylan/chitin deacetylase (PgdA/CDA1 family)
MTADEIRTLAVQPYVSIGAHSVHHLNLPGQPLEVQRDEVVRCRRTLEELIDHPVASFAYPYGEFNHDVVRVVRDAGFQYGVTVGNRPARPSAERLLLPRCEVPAVPVRQFSDWLANVVTNE